MQPKARTSRRAFTLIELIVVIAIFVLLGAVLLPAISKAKTKAQRIRCVSFLKQNGLAFRIWANGNTGRNPMAVSTNFGGTMEFTNGPNLFRHFLAMSNELSSPLILACPSDSRRPANSFDRLANTNISYFIGLEADETNPQMLLAGDRNLMNSRPVVNGVLTVATNDVVGWTRDLHQYQGNVGLADGSVQQVSSAKLQQAVRDSTTTANFRLAMP